VVRLACPSCATVITGGIDQPVGSCPQCGRLLAAEGSRTGPREGQEELAAETPPIESDPTNQALIADLREAFGPDTDVRGTQRIGPAARAAHGSTLFSRALGATALPSGSLLDDFEILGELGRGGMGVVYRARQVSLGREVALKVLPGYARYGRSGVERFRIEAQAAARLQHTNIVSIYAQGEHEEHYYYAMELVRGLSLDQVIRGRPDLLSSTGGARRPGTRSSRATDPGTASSTRPTPSESADPDQAPPGEPDAWTLADYQHVATLVAEVADALEHAHRNGVIHRDVKPHNLLLGTDQRLHLTDFGLARLVDQPHLTVSGDIMGTPAYLSPEQVRGKTADIDHRTDVYSLGVTLYELITRKKPFDGETREQVLTGICTAQPVAPRRLVGGVPVDLETICLRAMNGDATRRHPTAALLAEDLRQFAQGRPILSRRTSAIEKAAKWVRRHQALTAAIAAATAALLLAGGLTWNVRSTRLRDAQQLLAEAYDQLAFHDYRRPELVQADLDRAEALGADPVGMHRARALAFMGAGDEEAAIGHLRAILEQDQADLRAWYLLAWAQRRDDRYADAHESFQTAERLGPPTAADTWFFRGLAAHFDRPAVALESYRQATAVRAAGHGFYPQAMLHLARARNQQLYARRSIDMLAEADNALAQLIDNGHYEAYPYYLRSITHRLAAEIYRGSSGTRDDTLVTEHFDEALEWARQGQSSYPSDDRPITAEAECLESMGRFAEAIEARSRAIAVAADDLKVWEGYHYRWRLYYWAGDLESALGDLGQCAQFDGACRFYARVYPALVQAESGDLEQAWALARAPADDAPDSAQAVLWSATCLRLLGRAVEADDLLADRAETVDFSADLAPPQSDQWVRGLGWPEAIGWPPGKASSGLIGPLTANGATPTTPRSFSKKCGRTPLGRSGSRYHGTVALAPQPAGTKISSRHRPITTRKEADETPNTPLPDERAGRALAVPVGCGPADGHAGGSRISTH